MPSYLRIEMPVTRGAPEIELIGPLDPGLESRFWAALRGARVVPAGSYAIHHEDRVIVRAKLFDYDGSPLPAKRACRLLDELRRCIA